MKSQIGCGFQLEETIFHPPWKRLELDIKRNLAIERFYTLPLNSARASSQNKYRITHTGDAKLLQQKPQKQWLVENGSLFLTL